MSIAADCTLTAKQRATCTRLWAQHGRIGDLEQFLASGVPGDQFWDGSWSVTVSLPPDCPRRPSWVHFILHPHEDDPYPAAGLAHD